MAENQEKQIDPIESILSKIDDLIDSSEFDPHVHPAEVLEMLAEIENFRTKAQSSKQIGSDLKDFLLTLSEKLNSLPEIFPEQGINEFKATLKKLIEELENEINTQKEEPEREASRQVNDLLNLLEKVVNEASDLELRTKLIIFIGSARKNADDHKAILLKVDTMQSVLVR